MMDVIGTTKIIEVIGIIKIIETADEIAEIVTDIIMIMVVVGGTHLVIVIIIVVADHGEEGVTIMIVEEVTLRGDLEIATPGGMTGEIRGDMIAVTGIENTEKEDLITTEITGTILQGKIQILLC